MQKIMTLVKSRLGTGERRLLAAFAMALAGFVSGFGRLLGMPSQINVAIAVLSGGYILPVFAGSAAAYAISGTLTEGMIPLCAMLVIAGLRCVLPMDRLHLFGRRSEPAVTALVTTAVLMLFGCVMSAASQADAFAASIRMIGALLCGCTVFAAMTVLQNRAVSGSFELGGISGIYTAMLYVIAISVLTSLPLGVLNLGRAFGCLCMLLAVRRYHQTGGAVVGALTTCGVLMCSPPLAKNTLLLATSGLICGAFYTIGLTVTVLVFLGVSLLSLVAMGTNADTFPMLADMLLGSLVFILLPTPSVRKLTKHFSGLHSPVDIVSQTTSAKLSFASGTLGEIRSQLSQVSETMRRRVRKTDLCETVIRAACFDCPFRERCLDQSQQLRWSLGKLEHIGAKYNCVSTADIQTQLSLCRRPEHMTEQFNRCYSLMISEKASDIRIAEMRDFLGEQLSAMQDMLGDLSFRVGQVRNIDSALSEQVRAALDSLGYPNAKACVFVDESLCQRVEVYLTAQFSGELVRLTTKVAEVVGCDLDIPVIDKTGSLTRLSFCEAPSFTVETAAFCASRSGEYSGDTYDIFDTSAAEKYIVLSDGMGTGKRARLDSVFSVSLVSRLLRCGMSVTTAHKMVNSMMRVKGWEESFATLDILRLDLFSGSASLMKSGAAASYLCRDGGLKIFTSDALPAGILADCIPDTADLKLFDGDILMLASDGVDVDVARKLAALSAKGESVEKTAARLGAMCTSKSEQPRDDITIILAKIVKKQTDCAKK